MNGNSKIDGEDTKWLFNGATIDNSMFWMKIVLEKRTLIDCVKRGTIEEEAFARVLATDTEEVRREKAVKREE